MSTEEEAQTEGEGIQGFVSRALRRKMPGSFEQLLCQHLIRSVASDPVEKVRLICEAAMMGPDTPVDKENLEIIYQVSTGLTETRKDVMDPYVGKWHSMMMWGFARNEENFDRYIKPWIRTWDSLVYRTFSYREDNEKERIQNLRGSEYFWAICDRAHIATVATLETRFLTWAIPQVMRMFEQLSKLISPDLYEMMLEKMKV